MATNTLGQKMPATILIQLRPDAPGGVALGGGKDLQPGDTADVPYAVAIRLLNSGKATRVKSAPDVLHTRAGEASSKKK